MSSGELTIALDAMGGDNAPGIVIEGADLAVERYPGMRLVLVGDESKLSGLIENTTRLKSSDYRIIHTDKSVSGDAKPSVALRSGKGTSMRLAIDQVASGEANGVVSAGNTGALMAMSKIALRMVPGIDRPAMISFFPSITGSESCMLDLGANVESDARNLVQFALMGNIFSRIVLGRKNVRVGLLNVGSEEQKGNDVVREAAAVLRELDLPFEFHGFVEGDDITAGTVDVIVTDGFSGNIALKTAEGTSRMIVHFLREAFQSSTMAKLGYLMSRKAIEQLKNQMDPRRYNGAVFMGVNGVAVKSHGGTDALGFANAVGVAADMARYDLVECIKQDVRLLSVENDRAADNAEGGS